jgi:hypothetical protein
MSANSGYGKISTSGLTFGYDVGETTNSFKGKPTTNLVPDASNMSGWSSYDNGNDGTFITEFGTTGYKMHNRGSWNGILRGVSLPSTGTYTVSAYIRYLGGASDNNGGQVYTTGGGIGDTSTGHSKVVGEWVRVSMTRTYTTTSINFYLISYGGTYGGSFSSWEVTMPQIEAGSFATPWVDGSRSATQGLLDITGTYSIDSVNVSYSSSNELSFDGTDDYLGLPNGILQGTSDFTVCQIVESSAGNAGGTTFGSYPSSNLQIFYGNRFIGMYLDNASTYLGTSPWSTTLPEFTTSPTMITATRSGSVLKFYINGELKKTGSSSSTVGNSSTLFRIGTNTGGSERFTGNIDTTQLYNRALTDEEIVKNFIHYAKKYNMTIKDGSTESLASPSAQHLADLGIKANGVYWINNGTTTKQTYCEFKNGEGWMLVMNIKSDYYGDSYLSWNDYENWINSGSDLGNAQFPYVGNGQYRNRDIFRYYPTTKWMIKVHNNGTEFGDGSWGAWRINSTYSGQTFEQIMNIPGATGGGTQISSTYYAQEGMGTTTYARGLDYCSIARTLGHLRVNHLLDNNGVRILGNEQTLETANTDVTRGIGQIYDIAGTELTNQAYAQYNTHIGPYVNGSTPFTGNRRQFTDQLFPDNSNYNAARGEGLNVNPSLTYGGSPAMIAYYHYAIFIK